MFWKSARYQVTLALLTLPWLVVPSFGPSPQIERILFSALGALAVLAWVPLLAPTQRLPALGRLFSQSLLLAALVSVLMGGLQYFGWSASLQPWVAPARAGVAYANLLQRNHFATLTMLGFVGLWYLAKADAPWETAPGRWAMLGAAALLGAGNVLASSRIGLVEQISLTGVAWWICERRERRLFAFAALGYGLASVLLFVGNGSAGILGRFQEQIPPCNSRLVLWQNLLYLIAQKPWGGWGWGELSYAHLMTPYPGDRFCDILDNAHNLPLQLAFTWGVPLALLACLAVLVWVCRQQPWRDRDAAHQLAYGTCFVLGLHSLVEYPLWYGPFQLSLLLALGMFTAAWMPARGAGLGVRHGGALAIYIASFGALSGLCAYTAWDYWRISQIYLNPEDRAAAYRENTLDPLRASRLFRAQVRFAELSVTTPDLDNAAQTLALAEETLHFSPEPMVLEKLLDSAVLLQRSDILAIYLARFRVAFPADAAQWEARQTRAGVSG